MDDDLSFLWMEYVIWMVLALALATAIVAPLLALAYWFTA